MRFGIFRSKLPAYHREPRRRNSQSLPIRFGLRASFPTDNHEDKTRRQVILIYWFASSSHLLHLRYFLTNPCPIGSVSSTNDFFACTKPN
ncbi:hypothetical protein I3760_10G140200 [Carya illinoinensis]|nr:hypothetical protein I3760_10G140200 [Carya illinoinensis]